MSTYYRERHLGLNENENDHHHHCHKLLRLSVGRSACLLARMCSLQQTAKGERERERESATMTLNHFHSDALNVSLSYAVSSVLPLIVVCSIHK